MCMSSKGDSCIMSGWYIQARKRGRALVIKLSDGEHAVSKKGEVNCRWMACDWNRLVGQSVPWKLYSWGRTSKPLNLLLKESQGPPQPCLRENLVQHRARVHYVCVRVQSKHHSALSPAMRVPSTWPQRERGGSRRGVNRAIQAVLTDSLLQQIHKAGYLKGPGAQKPRCRHAPELAWLTRSCDSTETLKPYFASAFKPKHKTSRGARPQE